MLRPLVAFIAVLGVPVGGLLLVGFPWLRSQERYLRRYRELRGTTYSLAGDAGNRWTSYFSHVNGPGDAGTKLRAMVTRQPEPDLEQLRQRMWQTLVVRMLVATLAGGVAVAALSRLGW